MKVVHVEWVDSETEDGWSDMPLNFTLDDMTAHTVGFLVHESKQFILIAHSLDSINQATNGRIAIPRSAVKSMRTICQIKNKPK